MSGVCGADRIDREDFEGVVKKYEEQILLQIPEYVGYEISGSFNSDQSKTDFGDIDLIVQFNTLMDKKTLKKYLVNLFNTKFKQNIREFRSEKYSGRLTYNSGEIVTINFPQALYFTCQIDNIVSLSDDETEFKKRFLDMPAEVQGLVLGLVKSYTVRKNCNETLNENVEYEYNLSSVEIQERKVSYEPGTFKTVNTEVIYRSTDFDFVEDLFEGFDITQGFDYLLEQIRSQINNERALNRIVGTFCSMITVKSGEVGTFKDNTKLNAIQKVNTLIGKD